MNMYKYDVINVDAGGEKHGVTLICPTNIHDSNVNKRLQHQWINEVTLASSPFISPRLYSSTSIVLRHVFHHPHQH